MRCTLKHGDTPAITFQVQEIINFMIYGIPMRFVGVIIPSSFIISQQLLYPLMIDDWMHYTEDDYIGEAA